MRKLLFIASLIAAIRIVHGAELVGNKITEDGTYTISTIPGQAYVFSASGDFGSGSLAIKWNDGTTATAFANSPATSAETWTLTAPTRQVDLVLTGSTDPAILISLAPVDSGSITNAAVAAAIAEDPGAVRTEIGAVGIDEPLGVFGAMPDLDGDDCTPWEDPDAATAITAAGVTDEGAKAQYQAVVTLMKSIGVWTTCENAYMVGSNYQASSTTIKSLTGNNDATGTSTFASNYGTFNGTSNRYVFANRNQGTAKTDQTFVVFYKSSNTQAVQALVSNYGGGTSRGPVLSVGGSPVGGSSSATTIDNVYAQGAISDGTTTLATAPSVNLGSDGRWSFAALTFGNERLTCYANGRPPVAGALAELWCNNSTFGLGGHPVIASQYFAGDIAFGAVFDGLLSPGKINRLRRGLELIFAPTHPVTPSIVFDGNSLTASAAGGGTPYPGQLVSLAGWSSLTRTTNIALSGARQLGRVENHYATSARGYAPSSGQDNLFVLWSGINDITSGHSTANIIASLRRNVLKAKEDGFRVVILTLTPVAAAGSGLTYGYSAGQLQQIADINAWLLSDAKLIANQVVDLNEISESYPEFGDPTDSTYYVSGDGLHHNDAGRALIAAKIAAEVSPPVVP